jgi:hypothetical protein
MTHRAREPSAWTHAGVDRAREHWPRGHAAVILWAMWAMRLQVVKVPTNGGRGHFVGNVGNVVTEIKLMPLHGVRSTVTFTCTFIQYSIFFSFNRKT